MPVTGDTVKPRTVRSGWNGVPCSFWSVTPGKIWRASGRTAGRSRSISRPVMVLTVPGVAGRQKVAPRGGAMT